MKKKATILSVLTCFDAYRMCLFGCLPYLRLMSMGESSRFVDGLEDEVRSSLYGENTIKDKDRLTRCMCMVYSGFESAESVGDVHARDALEFVDFVLSSKGQIAASQGLRPRFDKSYASWLS
jgi:hypothetical protein